MRRVPPSLRFAEFQRVLARFIGIARRTRTEDRVFEQTGTSARIFRCNGGAVESTGGEGVKRSGENLHIEARKFTIAASYI